MQCENSIYRFCGRKLRSREKNQWWNLNKHFWPTFFSLVYTHSPSALIPFHLNSALLTQLFFPLLLLGMGTTWWRWRMDTRKTFNFLFMMKTIFACFSPSLTIYHTLLKIYFSLVLVVPNKVTSPSAPTQYGSMRENTTSNSTKHTQQQRTTANRIRSFGIGST